MIFIIAITAQYGIIDKDFVPSLVKAVFCHS